MAGAMRATPVGTANPSPSSLPYVSLGAGAGMLVAVHPRIAIGFELSGSGAVVRPGFEIEGVGEVHRASPASFAASVGVEVRFGSATDRETRGQRGNE